jgi:hypothetical protein
MFERDWNPLFIEETNTDPKPFVWTARPNRTSPLSNVGSKR